jgi:hypothetical protein
MISVFEFGKNWQKVYWPFIFGLFLNFSLAAQNQIHYNFLVETTSTVDNSQSGVFEFWNKGYFIGFGCSKNIDSSAEMLVELHYGLLHNDYGPGVVDNGFGFDRNQAVAIKGLIGIKTFSSKNHLNPFIGLRTGLTLVKTPKMLQNSGSPDGFNYFTDAKTELYPLVSADFGLDFPFVGKTRLKPEVKIEWIFTPPGLVMFANYGLQFQY